MKYDRRYGWRVVAQYRVENRLYTVWCPGFGVNERLRYTVTFRVCQWLGKN
jgi:hypothetical protein